MKTIELSKEDNSQDEMQKMLAMATLQAMKQIDECIEKHGHHKDGYTVTFAEVKINKKDYKMSICITPTESWNKFMGEMGEVISNNIKNES